MNMLRALTAVLSLLALLGCGSGDSGNEPARLPRGNQVVSAPKNYQPTTDDLSKIIDVPPYPGAKLAAQEKLDDPGLSPDERRYRVTLGTADPVAKVQAYYEKALETTGKAEGPIVSVFNRSAKGNEYAVYISTESGQTKIVETVIVYKH